MCTDTSGRYFVKDDPMTYYVGNYTLASDGSIMVVGEWAKNGTNTFGGFLMKTNDTGLVQWTRLYDSAKLTNYNYIYYYTILELKNGNFLLGGITNDISTENDDVILTRTDRDGNIIWTKTYKSGVWTRGNGSADYFGLNDIKEDQFTGDIFFTGPHWAVGKNVTRIRGSDGSVMWSKYYNYFASNFDLPFGLDIRANDLVVFSRFNGSYGGSPTSIHVLNKNTGDTISTKVFANVDPTGYNLGVLHPEQLVKLDNGNYAVTGKQFRFYYSMPDSVSDMYHASVSEFDANFNFVRAYTFRNPIESNLYNTRISLNKDGSGLFSMMKFLSGYDADVYYVQFKNGQILRRRMRKYRNEGMPIENRAVRLNDGSDLIIKLLGDPIDQINKVEFLKLSLSDSASDCLGQDDFTTYTEPFFMQQVPWYMESIVSGDFYETRPRTIRIKDAVLQQMPACRQVSKCDTLSLFASSSKICTQTPVSIITRKNPECGTTPFFRYSAAAVQSFKQLNDSTYQFIFKAEGTITIYAEIQGCAIIQDSITLEVAHSKGRVNLGADKNICSGSTIQLNAGKGYATYLWQDGSGDSTFTAHRAGTYHVQVTNYCGTVFKDTIIIGTETAKVFELGAGINLCENDSVLISAPSGFTNYQWTPLYRVTEPGSRQTWISPLKDTMYKVSARQSEGCVVEDSIRVFIKQSPLIQLQGKSSFCSGDSTLLYAGAGFSTYTWSNGSVSRSIVAKKAGTYSVSAYTTEGCRSTASFVVSEIHELPKPELGDNPVLCENSPRILAPGVFDAFVWSTGSTQSSIMVKDKGYYSVVVKDHNGCQASDSILIDKMVAQPTAFLPADTTICDYGTYTLQPHQTYSAYLWNTQSSNSYISVSQPGAYWLEVRNEYNCAGRDTINISVKDCLQGFFIPNAFAPASKGKNNVFKPMIFGILELYEFAIFNRWGQPVFRTTDITKGWDGRINGQLQNTGTYTWVCRYQLSGEAMKVEKGTVVLVR